MAFADQKKRSDRTVRYILTLSLYDFRNTYREPVFRAILFFPLMSFLLLKWGYPAAAAQFGLGAEYNRLILMWGCLQSGVMFGFIYGFLFLEEKEEDLFALLKILPLRLQTLITGRLAAGIAVSSAVNLLMIQGTGLLQADFVTALLLAVQFSLTAPMIAVLLAYFARNRIEGMAVMKIVNILFILPGLIYLFDTDLLQVTAVVPSYWMFRAMETAGGASFPLFLAAGVLYPALLVWFFSSALQKNIGS